MVNLLKSSVLLSFLCLCILCAAVFANESVTDSSAKLSPDEQNRKALEAFQQILYLTETAERQSILSQIESAYLDIIKKYPDAHLTQESYWRLISMYIKDYDPPLIEKAESLYQEFTKRYPSSKISHVIEETLVTGYYNNGEWKRLLDFFTPEIKEYIDKGRLARPLSMFMYSEAKFNLGDLTEAEKGYKIVIASFPDAKESKFSKKRLEEIKTKKNRTE